MVVFIWILLVSSIASDFGETFLFLFLFFYYLCKDDQPTPSKHLTSSKASSSTSNNTETGTGPATSAQFLQTKTTFFFFFVRLLHPTYVNKKKKNGKKKGEKAYIYTFVQKRHELRHYWCSVYTNKMSGVIWTCFLIFILLRRRLKGEEGPFLYINKNIPKKASFHNTQHVLGAQKVYGKVI